MSCTYHFSIARSPLLHAWPPLSTYQFVVYRVDIFMQWLTSFFLDRRNLFLFCNVYTARVTHTSFSCPLDKKNLEELITHLSRNMKCSLTLLIAATATGSGSMTANNGQIFTPKWTRTKKVQQTSSFVSIQPKHMEHCPLFPEEPFEKKEKM